MGWSDGLLGACSGFDQFVGKQISLPGKAVTARQVSGGNRRLRLLDELLDLTHHLLLAGVKLEVRSFLEVLFGPRHKLLS